MNTLPIELKFMINDFINGEPKKNYNKVLSDIINNDYSKKERLVMKFRNKYGGFVYTSFNKCDYDILFRDENNWNKEVIRKVVLETRPVDELKRLAKSLGCKNYSKCKKNEVIDLILTNTYPNSKQNYEQARFNRVEREQEQYYNGGYELYF
jgi:hypothetical protein